MINVTVSASFVWERHYTINMWGVTNERQLREMVFSAHIETFATNL